MKALMSGLGLLVLALGVQAAPVQALVGEDESWGFFLRPELKITSIKSRNAELTGVVLGPSVGRALYLGLGGYALVNSVRAEDGKVDLGAFDIWYTGLHVDYTLFSTKLFHGGVSVLVGGGQVHNSSDSAGLFVTEPDINLEFNLTTALELGVGFGYRFANGGDLDNLSDTDLSDWVGTVFLRWTEPED